MPYSQTYTKTITHAISNGINSFRVNFPTVVTNSGNERKTINERIPSGATLTGLNFSFSTGSGAFLGFSSTGPLTLSGQSWGYTIPLNANNGYASFFVRTGNGVFINTDDLAVKDISGTLYVTNAGATRDLIIEALGDASPGLGGTNVYPS